MDRLNLYTLIKDALDSGKEVFATFRVRRMEGPPPPTVDPNRLALRPVAEPETSREQVLGCPFMQPASLEFVYVVTENGRAVYLNDITEAEVYDPA